MEIINLLILVIVYYTLSYLEFYQKILLLFGSSMCVSFFINYNFFEDNKNDNLIYFMLDYAVHIFTYIYNFTIDMSRVLFQFNIVSNSYSVLEGINSSYLVGRNKIFQKLSKVAFNTFLQMQSSKLNRTPITREPVTYTPVQNRNLDTSVQNRNLDTSVENRKPYTYMQSRIPFTSLQNIAPYVSVQNNSPVSPGSPVSPVSLVSPERHVEDWKTYVHVKDNNTDVSSGIKTDTFKDSTEMNTFLDELLDKKIV